MSPGNQAGMEEPAISVAQVTEFRTNFRLGMPEPGCFKPGCLQILRTVAPFCALLHPFALLRSFACFRLRSFGFFFADLHVSASDHVRNDCVWDFSVRNGSEVSEGSGRCGEAAYLVVSIVHPLMPLSHANRGSSNDA